MAISLYFFIKVPRLLARTLIYCPSFLTNTQIQLNYRSRLVGENETDISNAFFFFLAERELSIEVYLIPTVCHCIVNSSHFRSNRVFFSASKFHEILLPILLGVFFFSTSFHLTPNPYASITFPVARNVSSG